MLDQGGALTVTAGNLALDLTITAASQFAGHARGDLSAGQGTIALGSSVPRRSPAERCVSTLWTLRQPPVSPDR